MRELVEQAVIRGYRNRLDEISAQHGETALDRACELHALESEVLAGRLTIEAFVAKLADRELLAAYTSQCCLRFR